MGPTTDTVLEPHGGNMPGHALARRQQHGSCSASTVTSAGRSSGCGGHANEVTGGDCPSQRTPR
jgi:hypothetical protein